MLKNTAKRVPKSAVFTIDVDKATEGANILGFIEGNVALTRVMLVVTEAFDGATPTLSVEDVQGGTTQSHFAVESLSVEAVATAIDFVPVGGTSDPLFRTTKSQWNGSIVLGGSTVGEVKIVVEYLQLDTEPGLHTGEDN